MLLDFEQRIFAEEDSTYIKDHTLVYFHGQYHIFYIVGNKGEGWGDPGNEVDFGHASSPDLIHWTQHPRILNIVPGTWKERNLWAPHVFEHDGTFTLAYTGVDNDVAQQIGLATSSDLFDWTDLSTTEAAFRPDTTWAEWTLGTWADCRDPYLRRMQNGEWMMVATAQTNAAYGGGTKLGALALGTSGDGLSWADAGAPFAANDGPRVLESPSIYSSGGKHYLLFTETATTGVQMAVSDSLLSGWDIPGASVVDATSFAAELVDLDSQTWFSRVRGVLFPDGDVGRVALIDSAKVDSGNLIIGQSNHFWDDWNLVQGNAFDWQPTFWDRPHGRTGVESKLEGHYWINTGEAVQGPIGNNCYACGVIEARTGIIRSHPFTLSGDGIELLVGGANEPAQVYAALKRSDTHEVLFTETGTGSDVMSRRSWDTSALSGLEVYIELADLSTTGHLNVDSIVEVEGAASVEPVGAPALGYRLQAAPNPGRAPAIRFELVRASRVRLSMYDVAGRMVSVLANRFLPAGQHEYRWDGRGLTGGELPPGVFFVRLEAGDAVATARVTHLR